MYVFKKIHSCLILPNEKNALLKNLQINIHLENAEEQLLSSRSSKKHSTDLKWGTINIMTYEFMPQNYMNFTWPSNKKLFSLQLSTAKEA